MSKIGKIVKTTKKAADTAKEAVATASKTRLELAKRGKDRQASKQVQKRYDTIQAELKWLRENDGAPESIAARTQSLKDMKVTHLVKPKAMKDVVPKRPTEAKPARKTPEQKILDIVANPGKKKTDMSIGGMATKNYVNPVKVVDNRKKK